MKIREYSFTLLICGLLSSFATAQAAPRTLVEWEKCRDKAEGSVDQQMEGVTGVEIAIKKRCGAPPVNETGTAAGVDVYPYDLVRSKTWKKKFQAITKEKYQVFVHRLTVASKTALEGEWVVGEGQAPKIGGFGEAAFAINVKTGKVYAAMTEDESPISGFGFEGIWEKAPEFLQTWAKK